MLTHCEPAAFVAHSARRRQYVKEVPVPKLSRNEFYAFFGFEPAPELTPENRELCAHINARFDELNALNIREHALFLEIYVDVNTARKKLGAFLREVRTCPPEVIKRVDEILSGNP